MNSFGDVFGFGDIFDEFGNEVFDIVVDNKLVELFYGFVGMVFDFFFGVLYGFGNDGD